MVTVLAAVSVLYLISFVQGQLRDLPPGPPYPEHHHHHQGENQWIGGDDGGGKYNPTNQKPRGPSSLFPRRNRFSLPKLSLMDNSIFQSIYNRLNGMGMEITFEDPSHFQSNRRPKNFIPQKQQQQQQQSQAQSFIPNYQAPIVVPEAPQQFQQFQQPSVQSAHVYIPSASSSSVHRPMPNVLVKYQVGGSGAIASSSNIYKQILAPPNNNNNNQQIHSESISSPAVIIPQYSQPIAQQYSFQEPQKPMIVEQFTLPIVPDYSQLQQVVASPTISKSVRVQLPSRKRYRHKHKKPVPHYAKYVKSHLLHLKKHHSKGKAFPVFTTIGKGLDGLNAVRRGVKAGTGKVIASGVKLSGKAVYFGTKIAAKVIKAASAI